MRILVVGGGRAGRRHVGHLSVLRPDAEVVWYVRRSPAPNVPSGVRLVRALTDADLSAVQAAVVAGPATERLEPAARLARAGVPLFVEKPLAATPREACLLLEAARTGGARLMVGYQWRLAASLRAARDAVQAGRVGSILAVRSHVGQWLPDWRPTDYRSSVSASHALGGGVLLELSHELDALRWLVGEVEEVAAVTATSGALDVDVEDLAGILLRFAGGAVGSVHLDMLDREYNRACRVVGDRASLTWDGVTQLVELRQGAAVEVVHPATAFDREALFAEQLRRFFAGDHAGDGLAGGEDGLKAVQIAEAARVSAVVRTWVRPDRMV